MTRRADSGLTLVEMLVALAILAVLGLAGLAMLDSSLRVQRGTEDRLARLERIDRALTVLRRDLATAAPGAVTLAEDRLAFARSTEAGRITVAFALKDGTLTRLVANGQAEPRAQRLLTGVERVSWRLLDGSRRWQTGWSAEGARPRAAEVTLDVAVGGRGTAPLIRLFPMPGGATP